MIKQHFLVSLKRTPSRLWTWVGAQYVHGFPLDRTVFVDGVDFLDWTTIGECAEHLEDQGLPLAAKILSYEKSFIEPIHPAFAVFASKWLILHRITALPDGWYGVWSDDAFLQTPYRTFERTVQTAHGYEILMPLAEAHPECPDLWIRRELDAENPFFYKGFINYGETMFVVRPSGAQQLLDKSEEHFYTYLDALGCKYHTEFQNVGTFAHEFIKHHVATSGMQTTKSPDTQGTPEETIFKEVIKL